MAITIFSLVGVPPLSGFWPKLYLFEASFSTGDYALTAFLVIGSFITLYIMARAWIEIFWKEGEGRQRVAQHFVYFDNMRSLKKWVLVSPVVFLTLVTLYIGLNAEHMIQVSEHIVQELLDTQPYIDAVMNPKIQK
jgi:multicomponent Na+:H+ antiporter subunit D